MLNAAQPDSLIPRQVRALGGLVYCLPLAVLLAFATTSARGQTLDAAAGDPYQTVSGGPSSPLTLNLPGLVAINQGVPGPPISPSGVSSTGFFNRQPLFGRTDVLHNWQPILPQIRDGIGNRLYAFGEFLFWDVTGMETPALVTTSSAGTLQDVAGVLGENSTRTLFGPTEINEGAVEGVRLGGGFWITPQRNVAVEAEYFWLSDQNDSFTTNSGANPILAFPYFNVVSGEEDAYLVAHPNTSGGSVTIGSESDLRSFLINGRLSLCDHGACCGQCGARDRTDLIVGYRHVRLRDQLEIAGNADFTAGTRASRDRFRTTNRFNGLQLGVVRRSLLRRRTWLESSMRVAIGNNEQELSIDGNTSTPGGTALGGVYALRSNIGNFRRDEFVLIPELGLKLGVRLRDHLHFTVGYSVLYFPNVVRAGEQIDTDINPNLIPPEAMPLVGVSRPRVLWRQSDYFAHGLSLGGELQF